LTRLAFCPIYRTREPIPGANGAEEFYDLAEDPYEHNNLLAGELTASEQAEYRGLRRQLQELRNNNE